MSLKNSLRIIKKVFGKGRYVAIAVLTALLFYLINFYLGNFGTINSLFKSLDFSVAIMILFSLAIGFGKTITSSSFISLILLSVLTGIFASLIFYKVNYIRMAEGTGIIAAIGIGLGFFAAGCASCGIGFAALIGLTGVLATLPFKGLEISILAMLILVYSIHNVSDKMFQCDIKKR